MLNYYAAHCLELKKSSTLMKRMSKLLWVNSAELSSEQQVLGVRWWPDDCFFFDVSIILQLSSTMEPTKCNVISVVEWFYDTLGILAPVIISLVQFKIFFQGLCSSRLD